MNSSVAENKKIQEFSWYFSRIFNHFCKERICLRKGNKYKTGATIRITLSREELNIPKMIHITATAITHTYSYLIGLYHIFADMKIVS